LVIGGLGSGVCPSLPKLKGQAFHFRPGDPPVAARGPGGTQPALVHPALDGGDADPQARRGGLRCEIVEGGEIAVGDDVVPE